MGTYAILTHNGTFGSAETGNMMELAVEVTSLELDTVVIRLMAFLVFGAAIVTAYLVERYSRRNLRKLSIWIDVIGLVMTVLLPDSLDPIAGLYPIFFCAAFQWGAYCGAEGYNSASIFITNNYKQLLLAWTRYFIEKDRKLLAKAVLYSMTVVSFFAGACAGCLSVYRLGKYGAFICLIPLAAARLVLGIQESAEKAEENTGEGAVQKVKQAV